MHSVALNANLVTSLVTISDHQDVSLRETDLGNHQEYKYLGKIAKVEGPQISFAEVEGLGTGTAVNGPIVAVALASY